MVRCRRSLLAAAIAAASSIALASCQPQDADAAADRLATHVQLAMDSSTAARDVLQAKTGSEAAQAVCALYTGWYELQANVRATLTPLLTNQLEMFSADLDPTVSMILRLAASAINHGADTEQSVAHELSGACSLLGN
jgi:transcription termination factor NusB